ncbi:MAG: SCP2 sterol-binding domain-containing protein [Gammaproteobacteria bacterium]|nr:SCP2 sterol-binding domain-containing protein [Gammaproteobacteria bacterium]MCW8987561.1 SCP2 sterol-binding domain-containing protein [Gammaproteobacteria bacterium]
MSLPTEVILTLTEALETSINLILKQDNATLEKFAALQGKTIAFKFTDLDLSLFLFPHTEGIQVQYIYGAQADTTLQGTTLAFVNMSLGDATESFFSGEVRIKGDIELGQRFKRILDQLDLDWEEWISQYSGDLIAFKAGSFIRSLHSWGKATLKTVQLDTREYLQDEGQLSPHPAEIEDFTQKISQLRDHTARLEARISRLQKQLDTPA